MPSRLRTYASFIRFSHTVFALPFALVGALLAAQSSPLTWSRVGDYCGHGDRPDGRDGLQSRGRRPLRVALDPRTRGRPGRELPRGTMSVAEAVTLVVVASLAFVAVTFMIDPLCFALSPVALAIVFWYSLAKRFTTYTQLFLGLALAVAPVGGWLAAGGREGWAPWLLALGTAMWVAGFDILYACVDIEFDRREGLRSIPSRFGVERSLLISRVFHVATVLSLGGVALTMPLGPIYIVGVAGVAILLAYEQSMVRPNDLSKVKQAFRPQRLRRNPVSGHDGGCGLCRLAGHPRSS